MEHQVKTEALGKFALLNIMWLLLSASLALSAGIMWYGYGRWRDYYQRVFQKLQPYQPLAYWLQQDWRQTYKYYRFYQPLNISLNRRLNRWQYMAIARQAWVASRGQD